MYPVCKRTGTGTGTGGQVTAADDVTFSIEAGAFVALSGASGSGAFEAWYLHPGSCRRRHGGCRRACSATLIVRRIARGLRVMQGSLVS